MTAIITTNFRLLNAENFKEDVSNANNSVYVGIGKSDAWSTTTSDITDTTPFAPGDHHDEITQARLQNIGIRKIGANQVSHVVPRYNWEYQKVFIPWDSSDPNIYNDPFYCITSEFKVYKCILASGSSTVMPTSTQAGIISLSDGYSWKYLYTITAAASESFLTNSYMPVKTLEYTSTTAGSGSDAEISNVDGVAGAIVETDPDRPQADSQVASFNLPAAGGIERIVIENGGIGYNQGSHIAVTIEGDGTGATVDNTGGQSVIVSNGAITAIVLNNVGSDYTYAKVIITDTNAVAANQGSLASARGVIAPKNGHGTDPVNELGGFYIGLNVQLDGAENQDLTVGNDFRQITILKNPTQPNSDTIFTDDSGKGLKYLVMASGASFAGLKVDQLVEGSSSGAEAYIVEIDQEANGGARVYYYQNDKTGYKDFDPADNLTTATETSGQPLANVGAATFGYAEYDKDSGEIIFLENRNPINRSRNQIEDIKCIIEF